MQIPLTSASAKAFPHPECRRILVPVDLSLARFPALAIAASLGSQRDAQLILLSVIEQPACLPPALNRPERQLPGPVRSKATATDYRKLEEVAKQCVPKSVTVMLKVCHGKCPEMIASVAAQERADLIVLATRRDTGLGGVFRDSIAEQVVRCSDCPVCIVRLPEVRVDPPSAL
jgi:nucleotide-binding universal stress UspA family protein